MILVGKNRVRGQVNRGVETAAMHLALRGNIAGRLQLTSSPPRCGRMSQVQGTDTERELLRTLTSRAGRAHAGKG